MNLYLISQTVNKGYDTYDSAVVAAPDVESARQMDPSGYGAMKWEERSGLWAYDSEQVKVELIGVAAPFTKEGVICASFNAG